MSAPRVLHEFPQHYERIVGRLYRRLGNMDQAREVAHDTWLHLAETATAAQPAHESAPTVADVCAYCCTVARHLHTDQQRRAGWLREHLTQAIATQASASHAPDVADTLMYRQALAALDTALAALPERAREVFTAHRIHGEPQTDIAKRLQVALGTVERDLATAHDHLAAALHHWRGDKPAPNNGASKTGGRRKSLASLLSIGTASVLSASGAWQGWRYLHAQAQQWQAAFSTPRGERLNQPLPDGSTLALDAQTRAEVAFDAQRRSVRLLQGAAFFAVQTDAQRPFVVSAGGVTVTVLGTRFAVELEPAGGVLVQVESGRVRVERGGQELAAALTAGQGLSVPPSDGTPQPTSGPAAPWRDGRLHFSATPLGDALQRLARYSRQTLRTDARAATLRVSGTVDIAHANDWLQALPAVLPVRVMHQGDGSVLIARR